MNVASGDYVLAVDKPEGPTSHDVVAMARRALGTKKVGHTGTLDPFASGLLLLCVGRATRLSEYLTGMTKSYVATARLGVATDSHDLHGEVVGEETSVVDVDPAAIEAAVASFVGPLEQVPPQFSAKKVDGEAMHRKARRGERVDLPPVPVHIHEARLDTWAAPLATFTVTCSTGTYIRAIARDLGEKLGCGAHLTALRRTSVGDFDVAGAVPLDEIGDEERVAAARLAPVEAMAHLRCITLEAEEAARIRHGQRIRIGPATDEQVPVPAGADGGDADRADDTIEAAPARGARRADGADSSPEAVTVRFESDLVAIADLVDGVLRPRKVFA